MSRIVPVPIESMDDFWVSFWSALYSGIIYSIITGLIVGLAVWWVQSKVERKRENKKYKVDISVFKSKLMMLNNRPDTIMIDDLQSLQPSVIKIVNFVKEHPITVWEQELESERELMSLLKNLQNDYLETLSYAHKLDDSLKNFIRKHNFENNRISSNDRAPYIFFVGKLFEEKEEDIVPWLDLPVSYIPEWIKEFYQDVILNEKIIDLAEKYINSRKELDNKMASIKIFLNKI